MRWIIEAIKPVIGNSAKVEYLSLVPFYSCSDIEYIEETSIWILNLARDNLPPYNTLDIKDDDKWYNKQAAEFCAWDCAT